MLTVHKNPVTSLILPSLGRFRSYIARLVLYLFYATPVPGTLHLTLSQPRTYINDVPRPERIS